MQDIKVIGIDLAKQVFQLHGTDGGGKCVLRKRLSREKLKEYVANLKPCLIGIEACGSAHYWSREFERWGHEVKIMSPQYVKPYIKSQKNDRNDAAGIAEAATRPGIRRVTVKTLEQQDVLLLHRARELVIKQRLSQSNHIRGLLAEYGIVIAKGKSQIRDLHRILEENRDKISEQSEAIFKGMYEHYQVLEAQEKYYEQAIKRQAANDSRCEAIMEIEGIGPITASAAVATIGDARVFKRGRALSAWIGLVPRQHSSGNKERLLGISKRGDSYLRKLLVHGARSVLRTCDKKLDKRSRWISDKKQRCGMNKAAVALANKNARILWAILATGECYRKAV